MILGLPVTAWLLILAAPAFGLGFALRFWQRHRRDVPTVGAPRPTHGAGQ